MADNTQAAEKFLELAKRMEQPLLGNNPDRAAIMAKLEKIVKEVVNKK